MLFYLILTSILYLGIAERSILVLGHGTVGYPVVVATLERRFVVTVISRRNSDSSPDAIEISCDRNRLLNCSGLKRYYDVIIDASADDPSQITEVSKVVETKHFILISSTAVYDLDRRRVYDEGMFFQVICIIRLSFEGSKLHSPAADEYGNQKVAIELEAEKVFGGRLSILRPTYVVGPGDRSGRYSFVLLFEFT